MNGRRLASGGRRRRLLARLHAGLAAWALGASAGAQDWTLADLMDELATLGGMQARFTEQRSSFLLSRPLELTGIIVYRAPDFMEKTVQAPFSERIVIESDRIVVDRGTGPGKAENPEIRSYELDSYPAIRDAVRGIHAALGGDLDKLTAQFDASLAGSRSAWTLELRPLLPEMLRYVETIRITGSEALVQSIRTIEDDGDESLIELEEIAVDRRPAAAGDPQS